MKFVLGKQGLLSRRYTAVGARFICVLVLLLGVGSIGAAATPVKQPVALYPLQCDETFSCPASLHHRVGFWVEVFSRWDTKTAIFHDKEHPERVYSTVRRKEGCRRSRKGDSIYRERKRLQRNIRALADKVAQNKALSNAQQQLYQAFQGESANQIRAAANRIRCQSGNRDRMREALAQFQKYRPTILDALRSQNLTPELQYLPFVESAFNPEALSHVGAAGLWQIMPSTGRTLGLTINSRVDERYDPSAATYAAALYFRNSVDDLSETAFENGFSVTSKELNPFVITSYNYGVKGMQRAIKQVGLDYERLLSEYKSPNFQTAVKNFYASFLAARHVAKNSQQFFGVIEPDRSGRIHSYNTVKLARATSAKRISKELSISSDVLRQLNPALKRVVWKHKALIPKGYKLRLPYRELGWSSQISKMNALPKEVERPGHVWHRVRSGETACGIAERYKASCRELRRMNNLNKRATIYAGKRIKVPTRTGGISVAKSKKVNNAGNFAPESQELADNSQSSLEFYRVRRGDTSCSIAYRFGMRCDEFLAVNGLKRHNVIQIGQRVKVSAANSWHVVRSGQTACEIAEAYRVRCSTLLDANRLTSRSVIRVGQRLRIPSAKY